VRGLKPSTLRRGGEREMFRPDVRFGSKVDICSAKGHVRFAPNSDRKSGFPQTVMSALPPKADVLNVQNEEINGWVADLHPCT
jgi:hypothetical protein